MLSAPSARPAPPETEAEAAPLVLRPQGREQVEAVLRTRPDAPVVQLVLDLPADREQVARADSQLRAMGKAGSLDLGRTVLVVCLRQPQRGMWRALGTMLRAVHRRLERHWLRRSHGPRLHSAMLVVDFAMHDTSDLLRMVLVATRMVCGHLHGVHSMALCYNYESLPAAIRAQDHADEYHEVMGELSAQHPDRGHLDALHSLEIRCLAARLPHASHVVTTALYEHLLRRARQLRSLHIEYVVGGLGAPAGPTEQAPWRAWVRQLVAVLGDSRFLNSSLEDKHVAVMVCPGASARMLGADPVLAWAQWPSFLQEAAAAALDREARFVDARLGTTHGAEAEAEPKSRPTLLHMPRLHLHRPPPPPDTTVAATEPLAAPLAAVDEEDRYQLRALIDAMCGALAAKRSLRSLDIDLRFLGEALFYGDQPVDFSRVRHDMARLFASYAHLGLPAPILGIHGARFDSTAYSGPVGLHPHLQGLGS